MEKEKKFKEACTFIFWVEDVELTGKTNQHRVLILQAPKYSAHLSQNKAVFIWANILISDLRSLCPQNYVRDLNFSWLVLHKYILYPRGRQEPAGAATAHCHYIHGVSSCSVMCKCKHDGPVCLTGCRGLPVVDHSIHTAQRRSYMSICTAI